jgi:5-methylcytosine-specific restriction endonuclease McrA
VSSERWDRARADPLANRAGTPASYGVGRARDPLPARLRFGILQRDGFRCRYCGRPGNAPGVVLHVDHVVPVAAGGATTEDNLLTACDECNLGKAARAVVPAGS